MNEDNPNFVKNIDATTERVASISNSNFLNDEDYNFPLVLKNHKPIPL